jgi:hypothetical protein
MYMAAIQPGIIQRKSKRGVNAIYDVYQVVTDTDRFLSKFVAKNDIRGLKKVAHSLELDYQKDIKIQELVDLILSSEEIKQGLMGVAFTSHLTDFIKFILCRYSPNNSFGEDLVHFSYCRVMERFGIAKPDRPMLTYDIAKNKDMIRDWYYSEPKNLFDVERSNMGNYIFSIVRNAHSNWTYHNLKKVAELTPPETEIPEPMVTYESERRVSRVLSIIGNLEEVEVPKSLRRYMTWVKLNG